MLQLYIGTTLSQMLHFLSHFQYGGPSVHAGVPNNELGVLMIVNRKSVVWRSQKRLHDAVSPVTPQSPHTGFEPRFSKFDFPPFFQVLGGMIQIQEIHTDGHVNHQSVMMRVRARKKF